MLLAAKLLEAFGIACVMIGLVQGILSETMWMELYLLILGLSVFFIGRWLEKRAARKVPATHDVLREK
jgi:hypothetical protein